jgi:hypothetical protein
MRMRAIGTRQHRERAVSQPSASSRILRPPQVGAAKQVPAFAPVPYSVKHYEVEVTRLVFVCCETARRSGAPSVLIS